MVDINVPLLVQPRLGSNTKMVKYSKHSIGPISLSVTIDRGGYCVGESIAISIEVQNNSRREVTAVLASLEKNLTFIAYGSLTRRDQRYEREVIQMIKSPGIQSGGTRAWNQALLVPAIAPITFDCGIIKLSYTLTVALKIARNEDLNVIIPVTIGNVPFRHNNY